jgi:class 3 adenylate cyclase
VSQLPQGTVTLVFTDIEGSTRLLHLLGPAYEDFLATHRAFLRDAFSSHAGMDVGIQGDASSMPSSPPATPLRPWPRPNKPSQTSPLVERVHDVAFDVSQLNSTFCTRCRR